MGNYFISRKEGDTIQVSIGNASGNFNINSEVVNIQEIKRDCPDNIKKLQECLKNHFLDIIRTNKIPFLDDSYNPIENYIPINFEVLDNKCKCSDGQLLSEDEVFKPTESNTRPSRRILAIGNAGSGKSTVCLKISEDWVKKENGYMSSFDIVLPILLRDVSDTVEDEIVKICKKAIGERFNYSFKEWIATLDSIGGKLLLVFDGYDEANEDVKKSLHKLIAVRTSEPSSLLDLATVLVTTRPDALESPQTRIKDSLLVKSCERLLKIKELPFDVQMAYVDKYFVNDPQKGEQLKKVLKEFNSQTSLEARKSSPLLLFITCYLYDNGYSIIDGINYWENVLRLLSKRIVEREKLLCMTEQDMYNVFVRFGDLCLQALIAQNLYIKISDIKQDFPEYAEIVETSGILRKPISFSSSENAALEPVHKSLMEYLVLKNVNNRLRQDENVRTQCLQNLLQATRYRDISMWIFVSSNSCTLLCEYLLIPFSIYLDIDTRPHEATALLEATLIPNSEFFEKFESCLIKQKAVHRFFAVLENHATVEDVFFYLSRCIPLHARSYDVLRSNPILSIFFQYFQIYFSYDAYHGFHIYKMLSLSSFQLYVGCSVLDDNLVCSYSADNVLKDRSECHVLNAAEEILQSSDDCEIMIPACPNTINSLLENFVGRFKERNVKAIIGTSQPTMLKKWLKTIPLRQSLMQKIKLKKNFGSCMTVELLIKSDKIYLQSIGKFNDTDCDNFISIVLK